MAVNETIVINRKWRKCIDIVNKTWQRISFWTHSSDVEFTDGKTAETKVGAIDGITDSLASNSSRIAASAKAVNALSNDLGGNNLIYKDGDFYIENRGADTGLKKLGSGKLICSFTAIASNQTFDLTSLINYKTLTEKDFAIKVTSVMVNTLSSGGTSGNGNISGDILPSISYNASTGILTLSPTQKTIKGGPIYGQLATTISISGEIFV